MVRLRSLAVASMMLVSALQVSPMMGAQGRLKIDEVQTLHATSACMICNKSIENAYWPDVVIVRCDDADDKHGMIMHTDCIKTRKDTHECACKAKLSRPSKDYIDHVVKVKSSPDALTNRSNPLYQRYRAQAEAGDCSICLLPLTTWPDTVVLHENHNARDGHAFHRGCIEKLRINHWVEDVDDNRVYHTHYKCPECNANIDGDKAIVDAEKQIHQDSFGLAHIQKYEQSKGQAATPVQRPSRTAAVVAAIKKYRIMRYPALFAAAALALHTAYVYSNAESMSVDEAVRGTLNSTFVGGCVGVVAALAHYARDWYVSR